MFRSELSAIQLLPVAKTDYIKKKENFIRDLKKLHNGSILRIGCRQKMCFGLLVYVTCDTLATQAIGDFKEGVGTAKKPCRICKITRYNGTSSQRNTGCIA